ncbi:ABC transporter ATP-binding protein [Ascidiaceihabitans sp.]|uniref:ABC transporter ATP-binding protein n=1 Tax=Ascidiaceihabitans sp. TaxID=1872644 RepID=UPI00329960EC
MPQDCPAISIRDVSKSFGPIVANKNITFDVMPGTIHGIIGENGAGKSTLMSILYGYYRADTGDIAINGQPVQIANSQAAIAAGIGMVFQHFKLIDTFTVLENVLLGAEGGRVLRGAMADARTSLEALSRDYGLEIDQDALVSDIGVGMQQRVEILKALYRNAEILILDEPTGVLTPKEADQLFAILKRLRDEGKTTILITHKLREIMDITDTVSVMRRGEIIDTLPTSGCTPQKLAELMVGRKVMMQVDKAVAKPGPAVLQVKGLSVTDERGVQRVKRISFDVKAGEILGIAGVSGNGQSEVLEVLGGCSAAQGDVTLNGDALPLKGRGSDAASRRVAGIGHIPEDRHRDALIMNHTAWENIAFGYHRSPKFRRHGMLMNDAAIQADTAAKMERFDVRPRDPYLAAKNFSGGNQQKLVVAREIENNPDLLLVGQPTRGVDIGAIEFIHQQIIALRDQGKAILLVSVELDEILALTDRVIVMFDGEIMGERQTAQTNANELGLLMAGMRQEAA